MDSTLASLNWIDSIAGTIWVLLTIIMVYTLVKIYTKEGSSNSYFTTGIFLLVIVWLYPLYTSLYSQIEIGQAGNIFTLIVTWIYMNKLKDLDLKLSKYLIPQLVWLGVATLYVGLQLVSKYAIG